MVAAARAVAPDGGPIFYVGDSPRDVAAGRAAAVALGTGPPGYRMTVVAVAGGRAGAADLAAATPDHSIAELAALPPLVFPAR